MTSATRVSKALLIAVLASTTAGCEEEPAPAGKPAASSAPAAPAVTAPAKPSAPVASAAPEPKHDCPENSTGDGSFNKPCEAKGTERLMEVKWTGKMTDTGPSFRVTNKAKLPIVYGRMAAYFYDKAGKQLKLKGSDGKESPMQWCAGKIFQGPMKVAEKAVITFSCVNKGHVPEGTAAVEAEMQMVGFTDDEGKQTSFYWRNKDLTPDERPKGAK
jgi:hypothetical protein